jgi:YD repeat-containing protein
MMNWGAGPAYPAVPLATTGQPFAVLSTTAGFRATYDANGSLLTRTVGGVTTTLTYNAENRVARVTQGLTGTGYAYDGDGAKVWEVQQVGATTPVTTVFLGAVEITLSATGRLTRTYYFVHGQRIALREQRSDGLTNGLKGEPPVPGKGILALSSPAQQVVHPAVTSPRRSAISP